MEANQNILTIFLLLVILLLSLFLFIRMHLKKMRVEEQKKIALIVQNQKELSAALIEGQERERARMAGVLHDDLIACLYRIILCNKEESINEMLKQSIQKARKLSHELIPPLWEELSIETLMLDFLQPFQQHYNIQVNFNNSNNKALEAATKLQLFRIFQEVLTNIDKHAKATVIEVAYRFQKNYCCLIIKDNGVGLDPQKTTGLGLKNITLRTQILNGSYKMKSNQPQGTSFVFLRYEYTT